MVNTDKTKIMVFNKSGKMLKNCRFTYNSDIIEMLQEFKYLGIRIRASGVFTRGVADLSIDATVSIGPTLCSVTDGHRFLSN